MRRKRSGREFKEVTAKLVLKTGKCMTTRIYMEHRTIGDL